MKNLVDRIIAFNLKKMNLDVALLMFRIATAFSLIIAFDLSKTLLFQDNMDHIPDPLGLRNSFSIYDAIFANIFCAILIAIGLFTRGAAIVILIITLSGLFLVHFGNSLKIQDSFLINSIMLSFIVFVGAGKWSLDYKIFKK